MKTDADEVMELSPYNSDRPADWRWRLGKCLAGREQRIPAPWLDPHVHHASRLIGKLWRCQMETHAEQRRLLRRFPAAYPAYRIYRDMTFQRWEMEARLLAGQDFAQIATICGSQPDVVQAFHDLFFCVRPILSHRPHILNNVIGERVHYDIAEADYDVILKLAGYNGGPLMLDHVIRHYLCPATIPENLHRLDAIAQKELADAMMTKALILSWTMPLGGKIMRQLQILQEAAAKLSGRIESVDPTIEPLIEEIRATIPFAPLQERSAMPVHAAMDPTIKVA